MDKKSILNALRETLYKEESVINEDIEDQVCIIIDASPGPNPKLESIVQVAPVVSQVLGRGLGDVQTNVRREPPYEGVEWEFLGHEVDPITGDSVARGVDQLEPGHFMKNVKKRGPGGTRITIPDLGLDADGTPRHEIPEYLPDYMQFGTHIRRTIKTPWMLFLDWLWLTLKNSGLEPQRINFESPDDIEGGSFHSDPVHGQASSREHEISKWYGSIALDPGIRGQREQSGGEGPIKYPTNFAGDVTDLNLLPSIHSKLSDERLHQLKWMLDNPSDTPDFDELLGKVPDIDLLKSQVQHEIEDRRERKRRYHEIAKTVRLRGRPGGATGGGKRVSEGKYTQPYHLDDDVDRLIFAVKSLGLNSIDCSKKLLYTLMSAPKPEWFKLDMDELEVDYDKGRSDMDDIDTEKVKSSTHGRVLVWIKTRQAGYLPGGPDETGGLEHGEKRDMSPRGKIFLPDYEIDANGHVIEKNTGEEVDIEELYEKLGPDAARAKIAEIVRSRRETGAAADIKSKGRRIHSQAAHRTMHKKLQQQKREEAVRLVTDIYEMAAGSELAQILGMSNDIIRAAIKKYIAASSIPITDMDNFSDFFSLDTGSINRVIMALQKAKEHFWTKTRDMIEHTCRWMNAVNEDEAITAYRAMLEILEDVSEDEPSPLHGDIYKLVGFKSKANNIREALRRDPNTYVTLLVSSGKVIPEDVHYSLNKSQINELRALGVGVIDETLKSCLDRGKALVQLSGYNDRARQIFSRVVGQIGSSDVQYLGKIIPHPIMNEDGRLEDGPFYRALENLGLSINDIVAKSKDGNIVPVEVWRKLP